MAIFEEIPMPSHKMNNGPSAMTGVAYIIDIHHHANQDPHDGGEQISAGELDETDLDIDLQLAGRPEFLRPGKHRAQWHEE